MKYPKIKKKKVNFESFFAIALTTVVVLLTVFAFVFLHRRTHV